MKIPDKFWYAVKGAVAGVIAATIVGFWWGGWVTSGTARDSAQTAANAAVADALGAICVVQFKKRPDVEIVLQSLKTVSNWQRPAEVEKWLKVGLPIADKYSGATAKVCAERLIP